MFINKEGGVYHKKFLKILRLGFYYDFSLILLFSHATGMDVYKSDYAESHINFFFIKFLNAKILKILAVKKIGLVPPDL